MLIWVCSLFLVKSSESYMGFCWRMNSGPVRRPENNSWNCILCNAMSSLSLPGSHTNFHPPSGKGHGTSNRMYHITDLYIMGK